jgi:hypothetical protein
MNHSATQRGTDPTKVAKFRPTLSAWPDPYSFRQSFRQPHLADDGVTIRSAKLLSAEIAAQPKISAEEMA